MTWIYWVILPICIVISFWLGQRYGANNVIDSVVRARDQYWHKTFVKPWLYRYNKILQDMAVCATNDNDTAQKRNAILILEKERYRRKAVRLAFKYSYFRKRFEEKPMISALDHMTNIVAQISELSKK